MGGANRAVTGAATRSSQRSWRGRKRLRLQLADLLRERKVEERLKSRTGTSIADLYESNL